MDSAFSILYGLEDDAYRKRPGVSQSELKVAMDCPQRLEAMRRGIRQPETPAMFEGKLLLSDTCMLECSAEAPRGLHMVQYDDGEVEWTDASE